MAHYALIDDNNIVTQVIVGRDEDDLAEGVTSWEEYYGNMLGGTVLRTSYNTRAGEHTEGGEAYRGNYAGIGYEYNVDLDAFIPPAPFASWVLNEATFSWEAPTPMPEDGASYNWDEATTSWIAVEA